MGNGYQSKLVNEALFKATQKGIAVVRCSRTGFGNVMHDPQTDDKYNFIAGGTLSAQKARLLLSVALAKTNDFRKLQEYFLNY